MINRDYTFSQKLLDKLKLSENHCLNLSRYKAIGLHCKALILLEKKSKARKTQAYTKPAKLLAILGFSTYLVYILGRKVVTKTFFIKILKRVSIAKNYI